MKILFTGHRNRTAEIEYLHLINESHPNATWIHGGARGFDSQVQEFARNFGITQRIILPDYKNHPPKSAPIIRNKQMLDMLDEGDVVVVCWDGRKTGGTYWTMREAAKRGFKVRIHNRCD